MRNDNLIDLWVKKYNDKGTSEEERIVLKKQIFESIQEEHNVLMKRVTKLSKIRNAIDDGDMYKGAKEYIGTWFEYNDDFFKILKCENGGVYIFYSTIEEYTDNPIFDFQYMNHFKWSNAKPLKEIPEKLQKRIDEYKKNLD